MRILVLPQPQRAVRLGQEPRNQPCLLDATTVAANMRRYIAGEPQFPCLSHGDPTLLTLKSQASQSLFQALAQVNFLKLSVSLASNQPSVAPWSPQGDGPRFLAQHSRNFKTSLSSLFLRFPIKLLSILQTTWGSPMIPPKTFLWETTLMTTVLCSIGLVPAPMVGRMLPGARPGPDLSWPDQRGAC